MSKYVCCLLHALALSACLAALSGCGGFGFSNPFKAEERVAKTFAVKSAPKVSVDTFNGKIEVTVGTGTEVQAKVFKAAGGTSQEAAREDLKNIEVAMTQEGQEIHIVAKSVAQQLLSSRGARVELQVPAGSALDLHTSNGSVTSVGPTGPIDAETSNGSIEVKESTGKLAVGTSNGAIRIQADKVLVSAHTSNGAVEFTGTPADGKHTFETSNGSIRITLPESAKFQVTADTSNGNVSCDLPLQRSEDSTKSHLRGSSGDNPGVDLTLTTSNGSIQILKEK